MYLEADIRDQKEEIAVAFAGVRAESGRTLLELVDACPVLLVFCGTLGARSADRRWMMCPKFMVI
jgi:hypothetical protein